MIELPINTIIQGDSYETLKSFPDSSIDLILTSPPYNCNIKYDNADDNIDLSDYKAQMKAILEQCHRVLKQGGRILINIPFALRIGDEGSGRYLFHSIVFTDLATQVGFREFDMLTWYKSKTNIAQALQGATAWGSWLSPSAPRLRNYAEVVLVFSKDGTKYIGSGSKEYDLNSLEFMEATRNAIFLDSHNEICRYENIILASSENKDHRRNAHPAPFSEALVERLLKLYTYKNDIVLDPFNGSGTTTFVAHRLQRRYVGIDLSESYCKQARNRLRQFFTMED